MPAWTIVTPASRGIGLEIARRLLRTTSLPVVATARGSTDETRENILTRRDGGRDIDSEGAEDRLHVLKLDVTDETSIADAAAHCASLFPKPAGKTSSSHLHLAFFLPGILHPEKSPVQLDAEKMLETFRTNTIGPLLLLKHFSTFLPRKSTPTPLLSDDFDSDSLAAHAAVALMSARVGSISDNNLGGWYSYRASKAGVNQVAKTFDNYLKTSAGDNASAISMHPGTVKTGLSEEFWGNVKQEKLFSPEFSAECMLNVVRDKAMQGRGRCWDWQGQEINP